MAERRRGLGRGLGALIPSGPSTEVGPKGDEEVTETKISTSEGDVPVSRGTGGGIGALTTSENDTVRVPAASTELDTSNPDADDADTRSASTSSPAGKSSKSKKKSSSEARTAKSSTKDASTSRDKKQEVDTQQADKDDAVSRETDKPRKRSVSAEARQKAMKARMDLGVAGRSSSTNRPSDMFFTPSASGDEAEDLSDSSGGGHDTQDLPPQEASSVPRETPDSGVDLPGSSPQRGPESDPEHVVDEEVTEVSSAETATSNAQNVSETASLANDYRASAQAAQSPDLSDQSGTLDGHDGESEEERLQVVPGATFVELATDAIHPNRKQPRQVFDEDELAELAYSISELGVLQPVVVRPSRESDGPAYELVMGERRWRATQRAGLATIPAIVRETSDDDLLRDALLENLHRSQLNPLEEAAAYQQLMEEFGASQEELSRRIGRSRPQISNTLRLLRLPALVQRRVAAGILSAGHARALLALEDPAEMERLAQRIVAEGLSVRATEEAVTLSKSRKPVQRRSAATQERHRERLDYIADAFSDKLDTSVKINLGARKGRMMIEFASVEDLNRIISVLDPQGLPESQD